MPAMEQACHTPRPSPRRLRVLSIHGGGMRGAYAAAFLAGLADQAAKRRGIGGVDVGRTFDLIVGTSTGGIIACALAAGIPLDSVLDLYQRHGKAIFPRKLQKRLGCDLFRQLCPRKRYLAQGTEALTSVLRDRFADLTIREVYDARQIALAIPAVNMANHRSWVFKTPHLPGRRDDDYTLVDVCLATSAAPLYRSMARVADPNRPGRHHVFVDGGLWANNPVLVGMIDALEMAEPGTSIEIYSLGNCSRPPGDQIKAEDVHRGLAGWKFGGEALLVSLDAQSYDYDQMAKMLVPHLKRECCVVPFPQSAPPASAMGLLDLDDTSDEAMELLVDQAGIDVSQTLSDCRQSDHRGHLLKALLNDMPAVEPKGGGHPIHNTHRTT